MILQIPDSVSFDTLFDEYETGIHNLRTSKGRAKLADKLAWILDSILKQMNELDEIRYSSYGSREDSNVYVPLYSKILNKVLGNGYSRYFRYLEECSVISPYPFHNEGSSRKYAINQEYYTVPVDHEVTDWTFIRKLRLSRIEVRFPENTPRSLIDNSREVLVKMLEHFDGLEIDYEGALKKLEELKITESAESGDHQANRQYIKRMYELNNINNKRYTVVRDHNVERVHTPVVRLKRELRHYLTYNGGRLVNVDIKNSQPYFLNKLLTPNYFRKLQRSSMFVRPMSFNHSVCQSIVDEGEQDLNFYRESTSSGTYYESLEEDVDETFNSRKELKKAVLTSMYSSNKSRVPVITKIRRVMAQKYPTVLKLMEAVKDNNYKNLSYLLQLTESELMIDKISLKLVREYPDKPFFTVHDSIICLKEDKQLIYSIFESETTEFVGRPPTFDTEYLF